MTGYPDPAALLVGWLTAQLADVDARVATTTPVATGDALADTTLPLVVVQVVDADDPVITLDHVTVDLEVYTVGDTDRSPGLAASDLARRIRWLIRTALPGYSVAGQATVARTGCTGGAARPWEDTAVARYGMRARLVLHARP